MCFSYWRPYCWVNWRVRKPKYELNSINYWIFDATFSEHESPAGLIEQAGGLQASLEDKAQAACRHFIVQSGLTQQSRGIQQKRVANYFHVSRYQTFMNLIHSKQFTAERAWGSIEIANMGCTTTRLHWTDQPYKCHINYGEEVFAVLEGQVEMRYRENGEEKLTILEIGDIFFASVDTEHVAHPIGAASIFF